MVSRGICNFNVWKFEGDFFVMKYFGKGHELIEERADMGFVPWILPCALCAVYGRNSDRFDSSSTPTVVITVRPDDLIGRESEKGYILTCKRFNARFSSWVTRIWSISMRTSSINALRC